MQNMRVHCYNCNEMGHYANKCPRRVNSQPQRNNEPNMAMRREEKLKRKFEQKMQELEGRESLDQV